MSLYAQYIKEREGKSIIETDNAFISYVIEGDNCYIADIYIAPEFRRKNIASSLAAKVEEIAKNNNCKYLTGSVTPSFKGATVSMKAQLEYGFEILEAHNDFIILRKEL